MNEEHYLLKGLDESQRFTFYASKYFTLNELHKKLVRGLNSNTKEDIIEIIRNDLIECKSKMSIAYFSNGDGLPP